MIRRNEQNSRPVLHWPVVRGMVAALMLGLSGCVTETTHSVYSTEVTRENAVQSHVNAAMDYLRNGDHDNAQRHLKSAHELDSRSAVVNNGLALSFQMSGEKELAEKHYKAALRADGSMTAARNNYGVFLYSEGRYQEACRQMHKVIQDTLYTGRADAFVNLSKCEQRLGNTEEAEEALVRAVALNRTHGLALLELAELKLSQGDYVKAQKYYQTFDMLGAQNARSLYVGIQLADYFGDEDELASSVLALKNLHPRSEEYVRYKQEYGNDAAHGTNR